MKTVWIARARHQDTHDLDIQTIGATKEAAERALRDEITEMGKDVYEQEKDHGSTHTEADYVESSFQQYDLDEAVEVPLHA